MALTKEKCVACRRDSPKVTDAETSELHPEIPEWQLTDVDGTKRLKRSFRFRGFAGPLELATRVGQAAESEGHHPRITLEWGSVRVEWWTHKIMGLHRNDFVMAAKTDELYSKISSTGN